MEFPTLVALETSISLSLVRGIEQLGSHGHCDRHRPDLTYVGLNRHKSHVLDVISSFKCIFQTLLQEIEFFPSKIKPDS